MASFNDDLPSFDILSDDELKEYEEWLDMLDVDIDISYDPEPKSPTCFS